MKKQTFGMTLASLRKERGMTQLELAEKMGVTDKAVSKWERDLSFPDVSSLPRLAEIFGISVDELMRGRAGAPEGSTGERAGALVDMILKGVAAAMGIAVTVLSFLERIDTRSALGMLGIGLVCLAISQLPAQRESREKKVPSA